MRACLSVCVCVTKFSKGGRSKDGMEWSPALTFAASVTDRVCSAGRRHYCSPYHYCCRQAAMARIYIQVTGPDLLSRKHCTLDLFITRVVFGEVLGVGEGADGQGDPRRH